MITFEQTEAEIRRLAAESPDHVDSNSIQELSCRYLNPDGCSGFCIFGRALLNLGIPAEVLISQEGAGIIQLWNYLVRKELVADCDPTQKYWMGEVQYRQDHQKSWSYAVATADLQYPLGGPSDVS